MNETKHEQSLQGQPEATMRPPIDVVENATGITIFADMPGVAREQLNVHVDGDTLEVEGNSTLETTGEHKPVYAESRRARFYRAFTLSRELDSQQIEAELRNGLLRIHIPKLAEAQPKKIDVKVA